MMTAFHRQHLEMRQPHACIVMNIFAVSWRRFMRTCQSRRRMPFFQMILMKVQAAYFTNGMYYYADRSRLCIRQGKNSDAKRYTDKSHAFDLARRKLLYYYNHVMSNGKWNGILTPEDFPPPRTAMYPSCRVPLHAAADKLIVTCWNNQSELTFTDSTHGNAKWIELANAGDGALSYKIEKPEWLKDIHKQYIEAGADIIYANTFGANRCKLAGCGFGVSEIIEAAVENAKAARGKKNVLIALDIGPIGQLLEPTGTLSFEEAYDIFREAVIAGSGCDVIVFETMTDLYELKAAVLAAKENSRQPIVCTMTFEETGVPLPAAAFPQWLCF